MAGARIDEHLQVRGDDTKTGCARISTTSSRRTSPSSTRRWRADPFQFLRATYWRWAETIYGVCRDLKDAPHVLAVGDVHVENFGTWRDAEGRLVWGVNDFDEAAKMPYVLDIVRLAASAVLAKVPGITPTEICASIAEGYAKGLKAPAPFVLDEDHKWLRDIVVVSDKDRKKFWAKFDPAQIAEEKPDKVDPVAPEELRGRYRKAIERARPDSGDRVGVLFARSRHRQPWAAAVLRRRPVARRPDRARGEGDGPFGLDARAWRRAPAALRRDRGGALSQSGPDLSSARARAGAAALAQRLQDRGRAAEEEGRRSRRTRRSTRCRRGS